MRLILPVLFCLLPVLAWTGETPIPTAPTSWVTDAAHFMTPQAAASLDQRLAAYQKASGHQVFVYIGNTTGTAPLDDWAVRAFKQWKVGQKGKDDGVVLFLMTDDHTAHIEVGYGLEGQLTDAFSGRIINDTIKPKLIANDNDGAVTAGAEAIVQILDGKPLPSASGTSPPDVSPTDNAATGSTEAPSPPLTTWQKIFYSIIGIVILYMLITHPSFTLYLLINILTSGRGGGGGGGSSGGGFGGGGGGRSGGGGASGSW